MILPQLHKDAPILHKGALTLPGPAHPGGVLDLPLPPELEAHEPPEARGLARDEVKLMVSSLQDNSIQHGRFRDLPDFLRPGDLLVINTSGTLNAALHARYDSQLDVELHLSTRLASGQWTVELRLPGRPGSQPFRTARAGARLDLPGGGSAYLEAPYSAAIAPVSGQQRLWIASLDLPLPLDQYLDRFGFPIRYGHISKEWPLEYYQTVYAAEPGSAEMPSAGRAFTPNLITRLVAQGVQIAPLILHTGVASLEDHEPPFEEYYRVPEETARLVNAARAAGRQVIAAGTTVVRALETVADIAGLIHPGEGWTDLVISPDRGLQAVTALLTGFHEPRASHLMMLQALAHSGSRGHLEVAYAEARRQGYLWHEFGDLHLILPHSLETNQ